MTACRFVWDETHLWNFRVSAYYNISEAKETYHQVLQEAPRVLELHIDPSSSIRCLLEEDGLAGDLTDVDGDFLVTLVSGAGGRHENLRTR